MSKESPDLSKVASFSNWVDEDARETWRVRKRRRRENRSLDWKP